MQIGKCDNFVTLGDALHHVVAAILAATHHCHHAHLDDLSVCVCVWVGVYVCVCVSCLIIWFVLLGLTGVCAHLVCLLTRLVYNKERGVFY